MEKGGAGTEHKQQLLCLHEPEVFIDASTSEVTLSLCHALVLDTHTSCSLTNLAKTFRTTPPQVEPPQLFVKKAISDPGHHTGTELAPAAAEGVTWKPR